MLFKHLLLDGYEPGAWSTVQSTVQESAAGPAGNQKALYMNDQRHAT